jgi:hypothetical protein
MGLKLTSRAFDNEGTIPDKYSKDGGNISPPLAWTGVPEDARSLALIVDDPDAPSGTFVHWLAYGITPETTELKEHLRAAPELPDGSRQGRNGFGDIGYGGPRPPSGTHRYVFHLYALDTDSDIEGGLTRDELEGVLQGHVLEEARLMGKYKHQEKTRTA